MKTKIIVYALICMSFLLSISGCNNQRDVINLYYISSNCDVSDIIETTWEEQVSELLGLTIDIHYISTSEHDNHGHDQCSDHECSDSHSFSEKDFDYSEFKTLSGLNGLVYTDDYEVLQQLINLGFLSPVEKNKLTKDIYDSFNYRQNNPLAQWMIPLCYSKSPALRSYGKDLIDKNSFTAPENMESLSELLEQIKVIKAETGKNIYFSDYETHLVPYFFADIFRAYGVFPNGSYSISYNPLTGRVEDIVRDESFKKALQFIKKLDDENLIYNNSVLGFPSEDSDFEFLSRYYYVYVKDYDENYYSRFISGENDSFLIKENCETYSIGFLKNTQNIKYITRTLISKINESDDMMMSFSFGVENINYIDKGDYYKITDVEGDYFYPSIMTAYISLDKPIGSDPVSAKNWSKHVNDYNSYREYFDNLLKDVDNSRFFIAPGYIDNIYSDDVIRALGDVYNKVFIDIFEHDMDVEEAVNKYLKKADELTSK